MVRTLNLLLPPGSYAVSDSRLAYVTLVKVEREGLTCDIVINALSSADRDVQHDTGNGELFFNTIGGPVPEKIFVIYNV